MGKGAEQLRINIESGINLFHHRNYQYQLQQPIHSETMLMNTPTSDVFRSQVWYTADTTPFDYNPVYQ